MSARITRLRHIAALPAGCFVVEEGNECRVGGVAVVAEGAVADREPSEGVGEVGEGGGQVTGELVAFEEQVVDAVKACEPGRERAGKAVVAQVEPS